MGSVEVDGLLIETVIIIVLTAIIASALLVNYYRTRVLDYMLISGTFIFGAIMYFCK